MKDGMFSSPAVGKASSTKKLRLVKKTVPENIQLFS